MCHEILKGLKITVLVYPSHFPCSYLPYFSHFSNSQFKQEEFDRNRPSLMPEENPQVLVQVLSPVQWSHGLKQVHLLAVFSVGLWAGRCQYQYVFYIYTEIYYPVLFFTSRGNSNSNWVKHQKCSYKSRQSGLAGSTA